MLKLRKNKSRFCIGLLSGTSVDGIDAALLKISGAGTSTGIKLIDFKTYKYPDKIRQLIFKNSDKNTSSVEDICSLNIILGKLFADAALKIIFRNKLSAKEIAFIGSHGQTIHHLSSLRNPAKYKVKSTLQIGDPSVIANLTGILTVGDFRVADCAVNGDGAPLVPYFDYILFHNKKVNRALLNIGGISNITLIPKDSRKNDVIAFDTGPGNMIIDGLTLHYFGKPYDKNGNIAKNGNVNHELLNYLIKDKFINKYPPKSTGREEYGRDYMRNITVKFKKIEKHDIIRTVTEFTAFSICINYKKFIKPKVVIDELIVSGGGAKNPVLIESLKNYFKGVNINQFKLSGIDYDSKEAALFAVLANECLQGNPANMPSVTGSKKDVILGKICLAYSA